MCVICVQTSVLCRRREPDQETPWKLRGNERPLWVAYAPASLRGQRCWLSEDVIVIAKAVLHHLTRCSAVRGGHTPAFRFAAGSNLIREQVGFDSNSGSPNSMSAKACYERGFKSLLEGCRFGKSVNEAVPRNFWNLWMKAIPRRRHQPCEITVR
jgi:hypothetical protein